MNLSDRQTGIHFATKLPAAMPMTRMHTFSTPHNFD